MRADRRRGSGIRDRSAARVLHAACRGRRRRDLADGKLLAAALASEDRSGVAILRLRDLKTLATLDAGDGLRIGQMLWLSGDRLAYTLRAIEPARLREEVLGDDMKSLRERSPVYNVRRIETPVLLVARTSNLGDEIDEMRRMRSALEKADKTVESLTIRAEGDVPDEAVTRTLFVAMLRFLADHLDVGRTETRE
jgi:hypothetical protein